MSYGPMQVFTGAIASGASTVSFSLGKSWSTVYAEVSSMSTAATLFVYGGSNGTTFVPLYEQAATATIQHQQFAYATSVVTGGAMLPVPAVFPYVQFRTGAVVSGGVSIKLYCAD